MAAVLRKVAGGDAVVARIAAGEEFCIAGMMSDRHLRHLADRALPRHRVRHAADLPATSAEPASDGTRTTDSSATDAESGPSPDPVRSP
ncbi:hypothetical protein [Mycobacterium sp. C31M]